MKKIRVWWIPQIGKGLIPFYIEIKTIQEGIKLIDVLSDYDLYQFENKIKPDYSNSGGMEQLSENGEWEELDAHQILKNT